MNSTSLVDSRSVQSCLTSFDHDMLHMNCTHTVARFCAFAASSWWPRSGSIKHSHFYRGGRGMGRFSILTSIVVAVAWLDPPPSTPEPRPSPSLAQALSPPLAPHSSSAAPPPSPHLLLHSVHVPAAEPVPAFSIALHIARALPTPS